MGRDTSRRDYPYASRGQFALQVMLRRQPENIQRRNGHAFSRASRAGQAHRVGFFNRFGLFELWLYRVRRSPTRIARAGGGKAGQRRRGLPQEVSRKFCQRGLNSTDKTARYAYPVQLPGAFLLSTMVLATCVSTPVWSTIQAYLSETTA